MAIARVVTFEGVDKDRVEQMKGEMEGNEPPEGLNATEVTSVGRSSVCSHREA